MESITNDKIEVIEAMKKREQERQLDLKKRQDDKNKSNAENEKLGVFQELYAEERRRIEQNLDASNCVPVHALPEHFDAIYKSILQLQKYVAASNVFLRVYDIQKSNKELLELTNKTRDLEEKLLPKKKFGFKNKKPIVPQRATEVTKTNGADEIDFVKKRHIVLPDTTSCGFSSRTGESLTLAGAEIYKQDVVANNLNGCTLRLFGNPSTLHLSDLDDCVVLSGPVSTSVFVENCRNLTLAVACQQLRLHSSTCVKIYLHVTSKGILEDCQEVAVAPYNFRYETIGEDYETSGLDLERNRWDSLDDFNWLNVEHRSPNWYVMEEKDRIANWDEA